jgi:glycosyltransferase involved in cell wall biosynthesis
VKHLTRVSLQACSVYYVRRSSVREGQGTVTPVEIFVFSYNRGEWLRTLLESIQAQFSPDLAARLHIFDDQSTDRTTLDVLEAAKQAGAEVLNARDYTLQQNGSRGGLHAGIEAALLHVARPGSVAFLLQDDMQIVRPVGEKDVQSFAALARSSGNPFVYVNFWTGGEAYRRADMKWREGYHVKFSRREGRYRGYTDVCFVDIDLLRASGFRFHNSEKALDHEAAALFPPMAWSPFPVSAMLPDPTIYRNGQATGGRHYRFSPWDAQTCAAFLARDPQDSLPIAENFLAIEGEHVPAPWKYGPEPTKAQRIARAIKRLLRGR